MDQDLLEAVQLHNMPRVRELLSTGLSLDSAPQPLPPMTPPLIEAVCAGHCDLVEMMLERRANLLARDVALGGLASFKALGQRLQFTVPPCLVQPFLPQC